MRGISFTRAYTRDKYLKGGGSPFIVPTMSLSRRIRHRTTRTQLIREGCYAYLVAYVVIFLELHFVGVGHYSSSFHREHLPTVTAARQAIWWALIGPVRWVLQQNARPGDWWTAFWSLDWQIRRLVLAGAVLTVFATIVSWRWMLPLFGLALAFVLYLHFSRPKDSL